jgi:inositol-phosphate phosphatase/L-galactose 1-phosphate phosphatase/histidinol-phosphatase
MAPNFELSNIVIANAVQDSELDYFAQVANTVADAGGEVIRKYFRKKFDIVEKEDLSKPL